MSMANMAFEWAIEECEPSLDISWDTSSDPIGYTLSWESKSDQRNIPDTKDIFRDGHENSEDKSSLSI